VGASVAQRSLHGLIVYIWRRQKAIEDQKAVLNVIVASDAQGRDDQRKCAVLKTVRFDGNVDAIFHAFLEWDRTSLRDASTTQPEETRGFPTELLALSVGSLRCALMESSRTHRSKWIPGSVCPRYWCPSGLTHPWAEFYWIS
jgi:hypothetical protein